MTEQLRRRISERRGEKKGFAVAETEMISERGVGVNWARFSCCSLLRGREEEKKLKLKTKDSSRQKKFPLDDLFLQKASTVIVAQFGERLALPCRKRRQSRRIELDGGGQCRECSRQTIFLPSLFRFSSIVSSLPEATKDPKICLTSGRGAGMRSEMRIKYLHHDSKKKKESWVEGNSNMRFANISTHLRRRFVCISSSFKGKTLSH